MFKPQFGNTMLYGADYNPEQWLKYPQVLQDDLDMMNEAKCNIMSVGIFSWAALEPEEGVFDFSWLDNVLDNLNARHIKVFLATPSAARPAWMSHKYPEVLRVNKMREHALHGGRHNHCPSSPVYHEKVRIINEKLAQRYAHHPAVLGWHISNEYGGECHCENCQKRFREWLQNKYQTLDNLNAQYWSTFWSHTYTSWDQIESPSPIGENAVHALNIDWQRFTSDNALAFFKFERDIVKAYNQELPVTTNFMEFFRDYDYFAWAKELDFVSWDSYPQWHVFKDDVNLTSSYTAMNHDLMRSFKHGQPFVLMESTPSCTNWRPLSTLKKPGMNILSSLFAVAHGADSIQYFQWRKSRGSSEKFHGAIVDHVGHLNTRVGKEVKELGHILEKLGDICGSTVDAKVAIVFDTQNRWAIEDAQGPRNKGMEYLEQCLEYYRALYERGINVDVIDESCDLNGYELVIAPMTYMLRDNFDKKVKHFVENGGTYVSTYWSGIVNENDLCFLGGFPGPLREVLGIWEEEIDSLEDDRRIVVHTNSADLAESSETFQAKHLIGLAHAEGQTKVLATYGEDFYEGRPVLTENKYGKGYAYYVASRMDDKFIANLTDMLIRKLSLTNSLGAVATTVFPQGVTVNLRVNKENEFVFIFNFDEQNHSITLEHDYKVLAQNVTTNDITEQKAASILLPKFGYMVLKRSI